MAGHDRCRAVPLQTTDRVSVIIPCYDQAKFLAEAIESVLAQTHRAHEIIVVDDGSPDRPDAVVRAFPGVYCIRQRNAGVSEARNAGVHAATGRYLVFLDADDRLLPNHLETSLEAFKQHPEVGMVCGDYRWFGADDTWHRHTCAPMPDHYSTLLKTHFIGPPIVMMVRHDVVRRVGGFRSYVNGCEDLDLYLRIARAYPIHCHHDVVGEYRRHQGQTTRRWGRMLTAVMGVLRDQRAYVKQHPEYAEALRISIRRNQHNCGDPLIWQMVAAWRQGAWRQAAADLWLLVRFYPRGLADLIMGKLARLLSRS